MQQVSTEHDVRELAAKKAQVKFFIRNVIETRAVRLICEEANPLHLCIAQKTAFENPPRIVWKNIVMTAQERLEAGIWQALFDRPSHAMFREDGNFVTIEHRVPEDDIREWFFANQSVEAANACGAESILILCGDMHTEALKGKLETLGHRVDADHHLVPERRWQ